MANPNLVHKTTIGFVTQTYDVDSDRWLRQEFIAGDDVTYEDQDQEELSFDILEINQGHDDGVWVEPPLNMEMLQPTDEPRIDVDTNLQMALSIVVDLANQNVLDEKLCDDDSMRDQVESQNNAINSVTTMLEECRRQRDNKGTQQVKETPYQLVIKELAQDCEGNSDLLDQALDAMRMEALILAND